MISACYSATGDNRPVHSDPGLTYREPEREIPVIGSPDVLVVGAGSALPMIERLPTNTEV